MKYRHLIIALLISLIFFFIIKMPIKPYLLYAGLEKNLYWAGILTKWTLILIYVWLLVSKLKLQAFAGFTAHIRKNYWMAVIPLVYPACWAYGNITSECTSDMQFFLTMLLTTMIMASGEEFVFRGIVQGYLIRNANGMGYHRIMLTTASMFALSHLLNLTTHNFGSVMVQVAFAFFLGMLFSALQFRINNIWILVLVHGLINVVFSRCGRSAIATEGGNVSTNEHIMSIVWVIVLFGPCLLIYRLFMRKAKHFSDAKNEDEKQNSSLI